MDENTFYEIRGWVQTALDRLEAIGCDLDRIATVLEKNREWEIKRAQRTPSEWSKLPDDAKM
mgnify:CR=1 FL=1